ncbi:beta-2-glycoprotein 1 [Hemicordylus capensis]|uniref:beta-2-glycoprotein 1 n=1 Tax=Hemicordylus capensis TaxID=884348 RepID=UPI0023022971|nr:beta-2-glycoprotein 1 [Hemicordylus capensis]
MLPVPLILWMVALAHTVAGRACLRPPEILLAAVDVIKEEYHTGEEITYTCNPGYVPQSGQRRYTCPWSGKWPIVTLRCVRKICPYPGPLRNGIIHHTSFYYQDVVTFSCEPGYILQGPKTSQCLANGQWSGKLPECQPVICPPPPVSEFGALSYRNLNPGNITVFQDVVKFECLPPLALIGNEIATCLANGTWSELPECISVQCPYPEEIENGFINFALHRTYNYNDKVTYGCNPTYVLDGAVDSTCEKTGYWSKKPTCRAPCKIPVKRATVLYNEQRVKVQDHLQQGIQHAEMIWFFCKNKEQHCSYTVPAQCLDGNFQVPACFEDRGWFISIFKTDVADLTPC